MVFESGGRFPARNAGCFSGYKHAVFPRSKTECCLKACNGSRIPMVHLSHHSNRSTRTIPIPRGTTEKWEGGGGAGEEPGANSGFLPRCPAKPGFFTHRFCYRPNKKGPAPGGLRAGPQLISGVGTNRPRRRTIARTAAERDRSFLSGGRFSLRRIFPEHRREDEKDGGQNTASNHEPFEQSKTEHLRARHANRGSKSHPPHYVEYRLRWRRFPKCKEADRKPERAAPCGTLIAGEEKSLPR